MLVRRENGEMGENGGKTISCGTCRGWGARSARCARSCRGGSRKRSCWGFSVVAAPFASVVAAPFASVVAAPFASAVAAPFASDVAAPFALGKRSR
eukprot:297513-Chlamydomonas_euryale.AAC.1